MKSSKYFLGAGLLVVTLTALPMAARSMPDTDADLVPDATDNCTTVYNPSQTDADCDTFGNACDADFDNDGTVGGTDAALFSAQNPGTHPVYDLTEPPDGIVDGADEAVFLSLFGLPPGPSAGVLIPACLPTEAEYCLGNVVTNGDFSTGLVYGSMPTGEAFAWDLLTESPQVVDDGCGSPGGAIQMWGNKAVGESIKQPLVQNPFEAGKTYRISVRYRLPLTGPPPQDEVSFRLSASTEFPSVYPPLEPPEYDVIGTTPLTSSDTCVTHTFDDWTAQSDASWLLINPENTSSVNDGAEVSWGMIDDICIAEVKCDVVTNGDFSTGLVYGSMPPGEAFAWDLLTASPQVVDDGCGSPGGAIQMWGNEAIGESIKQPLVQNPFEEGTTYRISVSYRLPLTGPPPQDEVSFRLSASTEFPSVYPPLEPPEYDVIGTTPLTSSDTCVTHTFDDWTAQSDASWLLINPENTSSVNDGAEVSWGMIDDICVDAISRSTVAPAVPAGSTLSLGLMLSAMIGTGCALLRWRKNHLRA